VLELVARLVLGGILVAASVAKLASPGSSRSSLASFGIYEPSAQALAWAAVVATELLLGAGVIAGLDAAAFAAAGLMAIFAATVAGAIMRGRAGAPCACFGARSTIGWGHVIRDLGLAACYAVVPLLPEASLSTDEWLGLGLAVALLACGALTVAVLALAREIGMLRLRLGPDSALEIADEGPPLGKPTALIERFNPGPDAELALAVFVSEGCHICHALEPAIASLGRDPLIALALFEELADADAWTDLRIPGSPYAVAIGLDGVALAKGSFNNLAQLESVLATAERRRGVEAIGA
jgi:uncharacterized membrane protein YphA (DoxX/SURF4 family)